MADVLIGNGQATYNLTHESTLRPMAITMGHDLAAADVPPVQLANKLFSRFAETVMLSIDSAITLTSVDLYIGAYPNPSGSVSSNAAPVQGDAEWQSPVLNTAVLVNKTTAALGRRGKGRFYLPGAVPEGSVAENGVVDANLLGDLQLYLDQWYNRLMEGEGPGDETGPTPPIVNGQAQVGPGPTAYDVTGFRAQNLVATQRRRLRR